VLTARELAQRIEAQAALMVTRALKRARRLTDLYGADLELIARRELDAENASRKRPLKSWATLMGTVKWVNRGGGLTVLDAPACAEWAAANNCLDAIRADLRAEGAAAISISNLADRLGLTPRYTLLRQPLRAALAATGELPTGCELTPETEHMVLVGPKETK